MTTSDLIELQIHSVRMLLLTRQHIAVLRDPHTERGLAVPLSAREADALVAAFGARASKDEWPFLQDLPQHLLEALGAQLQHVLINALAGQAFYATLTLTQGGQTRETDMRLSESLALAVRTGAPLYITRSLFESAAMLDLTNQADPSSWKELEAKRNDVQNLGREERLRLEENVRSAMSPNRRIRGDAFWERVWGWLLESLAGAQESLSLAQLRSLDIASTFLPREVTWDEQSMIAIRLPNQEVSQARQQKGQEEMAWLLVRPEIWKRISEMLQRLQQPEGKSEEQTPAVTNPFPQDLPPEILQRVEERLAWLLEDTELRTAFVSNPQGTIVAWKGADTEDTVRSFGNKLFAEQSRIHTPLVNQGDLDRQLGDQPQLVIPPFGSKKAVRQDLPKEAGGIMGAGIHRSGWKMIVIFEGKNARDLKEETHRRLHQAVQEMENILSKS